MPVYKIEWIKNGETGHFEVHGSTDEECIKTSHEEVESAGGEVTDYYMLDK